jgi:hypothetical protein
MGRKKRKVEASTEEQNDEDAPAVTEKATEAMKVEEAPVASVASSSYAVTSHSGEIIQEDIYISDGPGDSEEEEEPEIVLVGSRMGIMRRGLANPLALQQPNRQWTRQSAGDQEGKETGNEASGDALVSEELTEEEKRQREEEELAKLDPAQRAARLLQEKQRKQEEAAKEARIKENETNVSRDPTLFSKRTAFDIRFDQIEDKPWQRATGDGVSGYFNYGLTEEDWLEYSQQQLQIRQELSDASREKRAPDPAIVPIQIHFRETPANQEGASTAAPAAAAVSDEDNKEEGSEEKEGVESSVAIGPIPPKKKDEETAGPSKKKEQDMDIAVGSGGAWGAGAAPGSVLARLMEEQEQQEGGAPQASPLGTDRRSSERDTDSYYGPSGERAPQEETYERRGAYRQPDQDYYGGGRGGGWQQEQSHYQGGYRGRGRGSFHGGRGRGRGGGGDYYSGSSGWKRLREGGREWRR